jgi:hypothetical protein
MRFSMPKLWPGVAFAPFLSTEVKSDVLVEPHISVKQIIMD